MTDLLRAIVLGLVEGATEFLPISSTGHLIVVGHWLGFVGERANVFEIVIQLGAVLAVAWHYRGVLLRLLRSVAQPGSTSDDATSARRVLVALGVAFLPAAVVGLVAHRWITTHLFRPGVVAWALVGGGALMWGVESWRRPPRVHTLAGLPLGTAFGIGVAQVAALLPGMSRSASTIIGALALGVARPAAAEFSFLLAIPVMVAATALGLVTHAELLRGTDLPVFAAGFATAFGSALVAIRLLLRYVARHDFRAFAAYRVALGGLLLLAIATGWMASGA